MGGSKNRDYPMERYILTEKYQVRGASVLLTSIKCRIRRRAMSSYKIPKAPGVCREKDELAEVNINNIIRSHNPTE